MDPWMIFPNSWINRIFIIHECYSNSWMNSIPTHGWILFQLMDGCYWNLWMKFRGFYICLAWWGKSDEYGERRWHTNGNAKCFYRMVMWIWQNGLLDFRVRSLQILDGSFIWQNVGEYCESAVGSGELSFWAPPELGRQAHTQENLPLCLL